MTRRDFLWHSGGGLGGIALAALLGADRLLADGAEDRTTSRRRSASCSSSWPAAASHIDLFDFKPELVKRHGKPADFGEHVEAFQNGLGPWLKPIWDFKPYGKMRQDARRSRRAARRRRRRHRVRPQHGRQDRRAQQGTLLQTTGFNRPGFPGMGCWVSYGLGSPEREPADVRRAARPPRAGVQRHQELGHARSSRPSTRAPSIYPGSEDADRRPVPGRAGDVHHARRRRAPASTCWRKLNREHAATRPGDDRLDARIRSYELAAKMQLAAPEALDISKEPTRRPEALRPRPRQERRSTRRSTRSRRPTTSAASASSPGGCSSAACASCRSGAATTTASRAATGTATRTCSATTARSPSAWPAGPRRSSRT